MSQLETKMQYTLRLFQASNDPAFVEALSLYARVVPPALKTNTNEIVYWLDNYNSTFRDRLLLFGFYANNRVIGFAEAVYFTEERLLVIDYVAIDPPHRRNNVFFEFAEHIRSGASSLGLDIDYALAEVGYLSTTTSPSPQSRLLVRLLKFAGFAVIKAPYYQPMLGLENFESKMRAFLMVYYGDGIRSLRKETYLRFVCTVYYKHYLRWYSIYEDRIEDYKNHVDELVATIERELGKKTVVGINGYAEIGEMTAEGRGSTVAIREKRILQFVGGSLAIIISTLSIVLILMRAFDLSPISVVWTYLIVLVSFVALAGLISRRASNILKELTNFVLRLFGKSK